MENISINTMADVRSFMYYLIVELDLGAGFHPDTPFDNPDHWYVNYDTGQPTFADQHQRARLQSQLERCFQVCEQSGHDIYEQGLELGRKLGYYPAPDDQSQVVAVLFGADAIDAYNEDGDIEGAVNRNHGNYEEYEFATKAEADAFIQGLEAANDWDANCLID